MTQMCADNVASGFRLAGSACSSPSPADPRNPPCPCHQPEPGSERRGDIVAATAQAGGSGRRGHVCVRERCTLLTLPSQLGGRR